MADLDRLEFRKSSYSGGDAGGDCVECAVTPELTVVRDSKNPSGARLVVSATAWAAFLADLGSGRLD